MDVLLCGDLSEAEWCMWRDALCEAMPDTRWLGLQEARLRPQAVLAAVVDNPDPGCLQGWPSLRLIQSLWAGVDRLLADASLPADVPLARMVDPSMTRAMQQTALWAVLALHRDFFGYARQQAARQWLARPQLRAEEVPVLVLGAGVMGSAVAEVLRGHAYPVVSWRSAEDPAALERALARARIVVNLLALTPRTRGLIDARFLAALPAGAGVVNLARGAHVVEADLLAALDSGRLAHAVLDVFGTEPLPTGHAFWHHPRVTVLPHVAARTDVRGAATVVAENLRRLQAGEALLHLVDRARGY
jgi:glyoxylate/hydroxypyruvate reductase A